MKESFGEIVWVMQGMAMAMRAEEKVSIANKLTEFSLQLEELSRTRRSLKKHKGDIFRIRHQLHGISCVLRDVAYLTCADNLNSIVGCLDALLEGI